MRKSLVALLCLAAAILGWGTGSLRAPRGAEDGAFARRRLAWLEGENGRLTATLQAQQQAQDALAERDNRRQIETAIARLRALEFKTPVTYREIGRDQLPAILRQKLLQQVPEQEFADTGVALAALGLLPPGMDLQKTYFALLGEQIGAFYDQHAHELFTFRGRPLSNAQNRVVLAHELTHALQDQHFNLLRLPLEAKGNDDRALAASALVEGDATLAMNQYMLGDLTAATLKDTLAGAVSTDVRELAAAPKFLRESLLFPYLKGLGYCEALYAGGGWAALDAAYARPPASTAQILHPGQRGEPIPVAFEETTVGGQKPLADNVLGEFGARQLLSVGLHDDARATDAAAGWRGDRYLVYGDARASSWVWKVACADEAAARKLAAAVRDCLTRRHRLPPGPPENPSAGPTMAQGGGRTVKTCVTPAHEVMILDAQDAAWSERLERFAPGVVFPK